MNIFAEFELRLKAALQSLLRDGGLPQAADLSRVVVEPPRDAGHGDFATNAAMVLAKEAGVSPRQFADRLMPLLAADPWVEKVSAAGPGFINISLKPHVFGDVLRGILSAGEAYGRSALGAGQPVNVEFVSANPTGPMHVGHCRGAVFGDALSSLLAFAGWKVSREYYINDAGAQVDVLARSAYLRYREALGENIGPIPEGFYPGDYLIPAGQALAFSVGSNLRDWPETKWLPIVRAAAIQEMLVLILDDLEALGVRFDVYYSEKSLSEETDTYQPFEDGPIFYFARGTYDFLNSTTWGLSHYFNRFQTGSSLNVRRIIALAEPPASVAATIADLTARNLVYKGRLPPPKGQKDTDWEDREQTLFRATQFGDDVDRPLLKSDGSYTYFASDIAYHRSKVMRGFNDLINVFGADHGGYVKRLAAATRAVSAGKASLDVKIIQLVRLLRNGEPVKMSKRSGDFVTLREVVDEVGRDAVRFMMLYRKNDAPLDFDLAKVVEQSKDNPVFYVQYAHARCHSILRKAAETFPGVAFDPAAVLAAGVPDLADPGERALAARLSQFPRVIEASAQSHEPHRVAFYLYELASEFHAFWNRGKDMPHLRFVNDDNSELTKVRLVLAHAVSCVLKSGLKVLGVSAPQEMR